MDKMKPIVEIVSGQMQTSLEGELYRVVQRVGIQVDKDRLLQALKDARVFWREGYEAGSRGKPAWISVEERLPEPGQMVLVYCRSQMYKKHITVSTYTADYSYTRRCYWSRRIKNVTHWMPLPEPPKEEV